MEFESVPLKQWEEYAGLFDKNMGEDGDDLHKAIIDPGIIAAIPFDIRGKQILDAGCGNGHLARYFTRNLGAKVIGVDISFNMINCAKAHGDFPGLQYSQADLMWNLPFADESFDLVICSMVAQYVPNMDRLVSNLGKISKSGGHLILVFDHPSHALFRRALQLGGQQDSKFIDNPPYFTEDLCRKKSLWNQAVLKYYHRPLQAYIVPFLNENWQLTHFSERGGSVELFPHISEKELIPRIVILGLSYRVGCVES